MASVSWDTRTQIATGQIGSYAYTSIYYTFYLYVTATLSNRTASIKVEYTVTPGGQTYSGYTGPYWELYINNSKVSTSHLSAITAATTITTYTYTVDADAAGAFATQSIEARWIRDGSSGYAPKNLNISGTAVLPSIGAIQPSTSLKYWNGSEWVDILSLGNDYVVDSGTSGIWTYRKWNSGVAECWGTYTFSITGWEQWTGGVYTANPHDVYANYPSGLFTATPVLNASVWNSGVGTIGVAFYSTHSKTRTPNLEVRRAGSGGTGSFAVYLQARGTWK